jgi:cephalosporin hydroxylase
MEQVWESEERCLLKGVPIRWARSGWDTVRTTLDEIVILKPRTLMQQYAGLGIEPVRRILEVGVFEGGSALLLADMFPEAKIVGIDRREGDPSIQKHIETMGYADRVKLHFDVSQEDRKRVSAIIDQEFGREPIDLVIDDASHLYSCTTACFDIVWPRVRAGGCYVVEDWGWAHWWNYQAPDFFLEEPKPLSSMVLELVMATARGDRAVREVAVTFGMAKVWKGADLPPFSDMVHVNPPHRWVGFTRDPA